MTRIPATILKKMKLPAPGKNLAVANITRSERLAEKTIELTVCSQLASLLGKKMVWFGLTQKQERKFGFDAASNLGGRAFVLQFKASSKVMKTGVYVGQRQFQCDHRQMVRLVRRFKPLPNSCFYFLSDIGTFSELQDAKGDLINNSYLVDVADIPKPVPSTGRKSNHHYVFLNKATPSVTITSKPCKLEKVIKASDLLHIEKSKSDIRFPTVHDLLRCVSDMHDEHDSKTSEVFYKNAALVVILD